MRKQVVLTYSAAGVVLCLAASVAMAAPPVAVSPQGLTNQSCPTFSWSGVEGASAYELVVFSVDGTGELGAIPVVSHRLPADTRSWTLSAEACLGAGGTYAWSVQAVGSEADAESTGWSDASVFEVTAAPSADEVREAIATLRRYMEQRGGASRSREGEGRTVPPDRTSPVSNEEVRSAAGSEGIDRPLVSNTSGQLTGEPKDAPAMNSTPSLTVSDQIHLDTDSDFFKRGNVFLWDDSTTGNLALGENALKFASGSATENIAIGYAAMQATVESPGYGYKSSNNTAIGNQALRYSDTGHNNTAIGSKAMHQNETGFSNTAIGSLALSANDEGAGNTAVGLSALLTNTTGSDNTALGEKALTSNTEGDRNIALGKQAGSNLGDSTTPTTSMSDNIFIGSEGDPTGDEEKTIYIGTDDGTHTRFFAAGVRGTTPGVDDAVNVVIDSSGQLGTTTSSRASKIDVADLAPDDHRLLELQPVSFRYEQHGADGAIQYGLIAEEVAEVFPELVVFDEDGKPQAVKYRLLSTLLLNELQRERATREKELAALHERLAALETSRPPAEAEKSWWRRLFTREKDPP